MKLEYLLSPINKAILHSRYNMYWEISSFHYHSLYYTTNLRYNYEFLFRSTFVDHELEEHNSLGVSG